MGAVLGIAAFGRTQEKIAGSANNTPTPMPSMTSPSLSSPIGGAIGGPIGSPAPLGPPPANQPAL
jgi:hypothetical protein